MKKYRNEILLLMKTFDLTLVSWSKEIQYPTGLKEKIDGKKYKNPLLYTDIKKA